MTNDPSNIVSQGNNADAISKQRQERFVSHLITLYNQGKPMWTKDRLLDLERQLSQDPPPTHVSITTMNGEREQIQVPGGRDYASKGLEYVNSIIFRNLQELSRCPERYVPKILAEDGADFETNMTSITVPTYTVGRIMFPIIQCPLDHPTLETLWADASGRWNNRLDAKRILTTILETQAISGSVNKVVCFGLGSFEREEVERRKRDRGFDDDSNAGGAPTPATYARLSAMTQHAVALTIAAVLGRRFRKDEKPLPVYVQEPAHTSLDKEFLARKGFHLIGGWGSVGFTLMDDDSFIFTSCPSFPLKQIVADTAKPAAMIWNRELITDPEQWLTVTTEDGTNQVVVPFDVMSPRVERLLQNYTEHDFLRTSWQALLSIGNVSMWIRR